MEWISEQHLVSRKPTERILSKLKSSCTLPFASSCQISSMQM
ncbi:hypothetical protein PPTG_08939 [Phytophthora nicotianae INRA-310]|uniref:Uncharacterized protein n=1 Tax=Phytophthora nicotianae (strain INRA-310) TaxID=761204 RepID=W2QIE6_PHYN3|nr:hypothetical protein PPTG_08939 [Phytophthora nicotianae INRA-310]ETN12927.1 hypothetical protein PPTG_08939 [Phytophthora nicotianae INRA-310]